MHLDPLINEASEPGAARGGSFCTPPPSKEILDAEVLSARSKLREVLPTRAQVITTRTESASVTLETLETSEKVGSPEISAWQTMVAGGSAILQVTKALTSSTEPAAPRETSLSKLILGIRTSNDIPFSNKLADRLEELREISEEEFPEQEPLSTRSLEDFLEFIRSISNIVYPDIILTYKGNVRAEWTQSRNRHFAVEFLGGHETRFVVFAPDQKTPYKTNRVSGLSTLSSLLEIIRPYGVFDWIIALPKNAP